MTSENPTAAPTEPIPHKFTARQKIFIAEYAVCFNAAEAARRAGYTGRPDQIGHVLLSNVEVKAACEAKIQERLMSADEALARLGDMARGDIGDLVDDNGLLDIRKARENGKTKIVRKIRQRTITHIGKSDTDDDVEINDIEFEMYDAQGALDKILRAHGRYTDNVKLTGTITWKDVLDSVKDDSDNPPDAGRP